MGRKYKIVGGTDFVDLDDIRIMMRAGSKIDLIKEFRKVSKMGLRDSKDMVEKHQSNLGYDVEGLLDEFRPYLEIAEPVTKEEFMNIIEEAIDNMGVFHYTSMLDAVTDLCRNISDKGGLDKIAEERDKFLRGI